jgi:hypothetical protein
LENRLKVSIPFTLVMLLMQRARRVFGLAPLVLGRFATNRLKRVDPLKF